MTYTNEAFRCLTLAHDSYRDSFSGNDDAFTNALRIRLGGMIEMYVIMLGGANVELCKAVMQQLDNNYDKLGALPR